MFCAAGRPKCTKAAAAQGAALYNLSTGLGEQHDLSQENPAVFASMKAKWHSWRTGMDNAEPRGPFRDY